MKLSNDTKMILSILLMAGIVGILVTLYNLLLNK